jgi:hypothetical protein
MPGPIVAGAIVRWKARMLKISAARRTSASGMKYPESRSNPAKSWTAKKKAEKWDVEIAMKNCKANGFVGGGWWMKFRKPFSPKTVNKIPSR